MSQKCTAAVYDSTVSGVGRHLYSNSRSFCENIYIFRILNTTFNAEEYSLPLLL